MRKKNDASELSEEEKQKAKESYDIQSKQETKRRGTDLLNRDLEKIEGLLALIANTRSFVFSFTERFYTIFNSTQLIETQTRNQKDIVSEFDFEQNKLENSINLLRQAILDIKGIISVNDSLVEQIEECHNLATKLKEEKNNLEVSSPSQHCYQNFVLPILEKFTTVTNHFNKLSIDFLSQHKNIRKPLPELPPEIWNELFSFSKVKDLGEVSQVSSFFKTTTEDNTVWQKEFKAHPILQKITETFDRKANINISYKKLLEKFFNFDLQHFYDFVAAKHEEMIDKKLPELKKLFYEKKDEQILANQQQMESATKNYLSEVADALLNCMKKYISDDRGQMKGKPLSNLNIVIHPLDQADLKSFSEGKMEQVRAQSYFEALTKIRSIKTLEDVQLLQNWLTGILNTYGKEGKLGKRFDAATRIINDQKNRYWLQKDRIQRELNNIQLQEFREASSRQEARRQYKTEHPNIVARGIMEIYKSFLNSWKESHPDEHKKYVELHNAYREAVSHRDFSQLVAILRQEDKTSYDKVFEIIYQNFPQELAEYFLEQQSQTPGPEDSSARIKP